jgi:hypothetical protein
MIKIYSKKNSSIKRSVGIYNVHGSIDLKLRRYKKKEEVYNYNEYITNTEKFFLSNQINLYDIRNLKKTNFLETIIFIDTANPDLILRKYNINCKKKILIMREPPIIMPELWTKDVVIKYNHILTYNKDFIRKFKRLTNMTFSLMPQNLNFKRFNFLKKEKSCMFAGNKFSNNNNELYSERKKIIDHFINRKDNFFDLYGPDWNLNLFQIGNFIIKFYRFKKIRFYKGFVSNKIQTMSKYTFSFCYENMKNFNGYITEKIIDSMRSGCIPVYIGPKDVLDYIPKNSFIDANCFNSTDKLILHLKNMPKSIKKKYQLNILKFLTVKAPEQFSLSKFSKKLLHIVNL